MGTPDLRTIATWINQSETSIAGREAARKAKRAVRHLIRQNEIRQDEQRAKDAQLVRDMLAMPHWKAQPWAKLALTVAARAIERGRHWTPSEQLDNLFEALTDEADLNEALDDGQK